MAYPEDSINGGRKLTAIKNYQTISVISHPRNVILRIFHNRHQSQVEEIIAEVQAGSRKKNSTEQTFNIKPLHEKHLLHQQDILSIMSL